MTKLNKTKPHNYENDKRKTWTIIEDKFISKVVDEIGIKSWAVVATHLNNAGIGRPRTGKQCRTRWLNHLNPSINTTPWTEEEENIIYEQQKVYGNKWAEIAKHLVGR
jgi:Myb-like DNA-binding domain